MLNTIDKPGYVELEADAPESRDKLVILSNREEQQDIEHILQCLKDDCVVLMPKLESEHVDKLMADVSEYIGLKGSLEVQAAFASSLDTRKNIGKYYMSVNERNEYNIVTPHSEGSTLADIQLASFYCYENSTDGGETILLNVDQDSKVWDSLRELVKRGTFERTPSAGEIAKARALYRVNLPENSLQPDDKILRQSRIDSNLTIIDVLAKLKKTYSRVLDKEQYVFWDSISATDTDVLYFMEGLLKQFGLFKTPPDYNSVEEIDWDPHRRVRRSGIDYEQLFKEKIVYKLEPGDFILMNNLTWCHSVNNWTPDSGKRIVAAAFA